MRLAGWLGTITCLLTTAFAQESGQSVKGDQLDDLDFRFRIAKPDSSWRLLPEAEIKRIVPDAVAGAMGIGGRSRGCIGAVIIEPIHEMEVSVLVDLILDGMPIEEVLAREEMKFAGVPAVRLSVRGNVDDTPFRYETIVFAHDEHGYQLVAVGLAGQVGDGAVLRKFHDLIELLPGPVRGRFGSGKLKDLHGVGWDVVDGAFASAALRLAVAPPEGWRLMVGDELDAVNADAEVGLASADSMVYLVVIAEPVAGMEREAFASSLLKGTLEGLGLSAAKSTVELEAGGGKRQFSILDPPDGPITYVYGTWYHGDICYQGLCWYVRSDADRMPQVAEGLKTIRHPDATEVDRIAARVRGKLEPDNQVGLDYSVRDGLFQHFKYGLRLRKPATGFWRAVSGQAAREYGPGVVILMEEPALGLFLKVEVERLQEALSARELHEIAAQFEQQALVAPKFSEVKDGKIGGVACVSGTMWEGGDGLDLFYSMWTSRIGRHALWVTGWGLTGNMTTHRPALDALLAGFTVGDGPLDMVESDARRYIDHRLGFRISPDFQVQGFREQTPADIEALGSLVEVRGESLYVLAINAVAFDQDADFFASMIEPVIDNLLPPLLRGQDKSQADATLAGRPATRSSWGTDRMGCDIFTTVKGRTYYCVIAVGDKDERRSKAAWLQLD